jgi:hypothetical protein
LEARRSTGARGRRLGARFGVQRNSQGQRFVVARGPTVTSSCGCRDLRRLELPASTAACLEVYAAAEVQRPLGGSASSSGGSCGGGAGRPGYRHCELGLVRPLFPARSLVPAVSSAPSWWQVGSRGSDRRRAWWLADSSSAASSSSSGPTPGRGSAVEVLGAVTSKCSGGLGAGHGSRKRVARRRARVEPSAPTTTSSTLASSQRHLSGARHTQAPSPGEGGRLREREVGVGTTCRRVGNGSTAEPRTWAEPGRRRCPYTLLG